MVYLVLTRAGFEQARTVMKRGDVLWVGHRVLSSKEQEALKEQGIDLGGVFSSDMDPADAGGVAGWTYTVAEHHPDQPIWVEQEDDALEHRRKDHRSLQHWIVVVLLMISAGYCVVSGFAVSRGKEVSTSIDVLWNVAFAALVALWARNDDRFPITRSKGDSSYLLIFAFWPIVLLNHAVRSRGVDGLVLYLGFLGIFFAPFLVQMVVFVSRVL